MLAAEAESAGDAWVKVIDFGLAKAVVTESDMAGDTFTTRGGFLGTPQFASPEQINRDELDVRSISTASA
jgi:serine/threonine protein kinase